MNNLQERLANLRREYSALELDEHSVMHDPLKQFEFWMEQALEAKLDEPNAMTLATSDAAGQPDLRVVLLRGFNRDGFSFFTNYQSRKGEELAVNKKACLNFFWPELQRQVRITGAVSKATARVSDGYFASRPRESQLGAWASRQSEEIKDRKELMDLYEYYSEHYKGLDVPRPKFWGGYILKPQRIEFWQGRANRLHDRILFEKKKDARWRVARLSP